MGKGARHRAYLWVTGIYPVWCIRSEVEVAKQLVESRARRDLANISNTLRGGTLEVN